MSSLQDIKDRHLDAFVQEVIPLAREIVKGYVPIDTREFQSAIIAFATPDKQAMVGVQHKTLDYSEKKRRLEKEGNAPFEVWESMDSLVLAHILEIGVGHFNNGPRTLRRTRDADMAGVSNDAGDFTRNWWANAMLKLDEELDPIANKHVNNYITEASSFIFTDNGWGVS